MKRFRRLVVIGLMLIFIVRSVVLPVGAEGSGVVRVRVQTPPTAAALPLLWMEKNDLPGRGVELKVDISPDHNRAVALISKNEIDMMVTGVNVGAKAYNKGIDLVHLNTNTWAIDYLLTGGFKGESWGDLKGKTLCLPLKGGPLDFLAHYFLRENGIDPEEVRFIYRPLANGAQTFQLGRLEAIILPEPLVTITLSRREDAFLALDLQQEWGRLHQGDERVPYIGLFASGEFVRENRQLAERINNYYRQGVEWVNTHPDEAAALGAGHFGMPAPVLRKAFARINLNYFPRVETFRLLEVYFAEILKIYPEMIGGKMPDEHFYF